VALRSREEEEKQSQRTVVQHGTFKVLVFGTGMFFAIKWHYDQGKKKKNKASGR